MNAVEKNHLEANTQSLIDSTMLRVRANGVELTMNGRCSPYLSHQTAEFAADYNPRWGACQLSNEWANVVITPAVDRDVDAHSITGWNYIDGVAVPREYVTHRHEAVCEPLTALVPASMFAPLREAMYLAGYELPHEGVIRVKWWIPAIDGFDDSGKPIFRLPSNVTIDEDGVELSDEELLGTTTLAKLGITT